jgi:Stigma-specific protein, Stig1
MDAQHFDALSRTLATHPSRRRVLHTLGGALVAARLGTANDPAALAYRKCRLPDGRRGRRCHGACLDVKNDPDNCGGCGRVCASGTFCCNGWCADPDQNPPDCCPPSLSCGGICTSPYDDRANCGGCGLACADDQDCCDGRCLTRGTAANCDGCATCAWGGDWVCDPNLYGEGRPGCDCQGDTCPLG